MEIVNIKHHIEAKVFTSWTGREELSKQNCKTFFLMDLLTIRWSSYCMSFAFKPWETVDASTQGPVPPPAKQWDSGGQLEQAGTGPGGLLHSISLASFSNLSYKIL